MNLCVIGTGYVGLVTGCIFSDMGNEVICVDKDPEMIAMLERGEMPIYEPGLEEMVRRNVEDRRLSFTTDFAAAVEHSDVIFICVGTPPKDNGDPDMSYVEEAAKGIARSLNRYRSFRWRCSILEQPGSARSARGCSVMEQRDSAWQARGYSVLEQP